ncbi:MAG: hypothetical protein M3R66_01220, partial [Actinomycetota bacterium]|nr:hypothetical protein [Actinomycetota bacterium]
LRGGFVGGRTWLWQSRATRGTCTWIGRASALAVTIAAAVTAWLVPWRDLIAAFVPTETHLLTLAVMLGCLAAAATALTRRTPTIAA